MATNPTVAAPKTAAKQDFIPMEMSERQLEVPPLPGFKLYWFADRPGRIVRAQKIGWTFVSQDEVDVPNFKTVAGDVMQSGNQDLGNRISVYGHSDANGKAVNLYLMKLPEEHWKMVEQMREQHSDRIVESLQGIPQERAKGESADDHATRYTPKGVRNTMFQKKR